MAPHKKVRDDGAGGLPRASGDGPLLALQKEGLMMVAPRERGWPPFDPAALFPARGCPARAGMAPPRRFVPMFAHGLPRASGDGPVFIVWRNKAKAVAPRERGWPPVGQDYTLTGDGCPARAGMAPRRGNRASPAPGLPRAVFCGPDAGRGCPARAGMAPHGLQSRLVSCRLPRASGDGRRGRLDIEGPAAVALRERG